MENRCCVGRVFTCLPENVTIPMAKDTSVCPAGSLWMCPWDMCQTQWQGRASSPPGLGGAGPDTRAVLLPPHSHGPGSHWDAPFLLPGPLCVGGWGGGGNPLPTALPGCFSSPEGPPALPVAPRPVPAVRPLHSPPGWACGPHGPPTSVVCVSS